MLVAAAVWLALRWRERAGTARAAALLGLYAALFVLSHVLGDVLGTWGAVLTVAAVMAVATAALPVGEPGAGYGDSDPGSDMESHEVDLEDAAELHQAREERHSTLGAGISRAMVGLYKRHYGKGPVRCRTYVEPDLVMVVLGEGYTAAEQTMFEAGRWHEVRSARQIWQDSMEKRFVTTIEELSGRKVKACSSSETGHVRDLAAGGAGDLVHRLGERQQARAGQLVELADVAVVGERGDGDVGDVVGVDERLRRVAGRAARRRRSGRGRACSPR